MSGSRRVRRGISHWFQFLSCSYVVGTILPPLLPTVFTVRMKIWIGLPGEFLLNRSCCMVGFCWSLG